MVPRGGLAEVGCFPHMLILKLGLVQKDHIYSIPGAFGRWRLNEKSFGLSVRGKMYFQ